MGRSCLCPVSRPFSSSDTLHREHYIFCVLFIRWRYLSDNFGWDEFDSKRIWVAVSGCTNHKTVCREILIDFVRYDRPKTIMTSGFYRKSLGTGIFKYKHGDKIGQLYGVIYVENLPFNLLSVGKISRNGLSVISGQDGKDKVYNNRKIALTG